jgi:hypothetical protein
MTSSDEATAKSAPDQRESLGHQAADLARDAADEVADLGGRIVAAGRRVAAAASQTPGQGLARLRELRRRNRLPLENLYDLHPEARRAPRRDLGLLTIPVARIRGTAVEGPPQRGRDFLPLPMLRSSNWQGRWQRLRHAQDRLAILPPIDVVQTGEGYWVVDGHNRVGLALYGNQDDIDASVTHLHLPGASDADVRAGSLATVLDDARQVRAAGEGRLARGATARSQRRCPREEPPSAEAPSAEPPNDEPPNGEP